MKATMLIKTKDKLEEILVDTNAIHKINSYTWFITDKGYVVTDIRYGPRRQNKKRRLYMHRIINETPKNYETDHINGNKLDNRKCNLRTVTRSQNQHNLHDGSKGYYWDNTWQKYKVEIWNNSQKIYIGMYDFEWEAQIAYKSAKKVRDYIYG